MRTPKRAVEGCALLLKTLRELVILARSLWGARGVGNYAPHHKESNRPENDDNIVLFHGNIVYTLERPGKSPMDSLPNVLYSLIMSTYHILLVEDSEPLRKVLAEKLRENGLDVIEAASGEEGLKLALERRPDLILTDLVMYPMDGIEMATRIRQSDSWGSQAKIVALTNQNSAEEENRINAAGFDAYLVKAETGLDEVVKNARQIIENRSKK